MSGAARPNVGTRVRAVLRGERRADALETMRRAGASVYGELAEAEKARATLMIDQKNVWTAEPAVGGHLLATWNAFVLQTLGEAMLDADYVVDPGTVGFVPPVTFEQTWSWLATAAEWLSIAQQARANPDYDPRDLFDLPSDPPAFVEVEPCPQAHLEAMLAAIPSVRQHAELALFDLDKSSQADDSPRQLTRPRQINRKRQLNRLRQVAAEASAAADYAASLRTSSADRSLHEYVEKHLKRSLVLWFHLGQLAAMPALIAGYHQGFGPVRVDAATLPGGPRFDPWCLTDPRSISTWQADPRARRAIAMLWATDPEPAATLAIQAAIDRAMADGHIVRAPSRGEGGLHYYCCPWSPIYQVRRPVRLGGRELSTVQQFTFDVSGEELAEGGEFIRRIITGPFRDTTKVDYCDPTGEDGRHR
jgi:hypothetical protein